MRQALIVGVFATLSVCKTKGHRRPRRAGAGSAGCGVDGACKNPLPLHGRSMQRSAAPLSGILRIIYRPTGRKYSPTSRFSPFAKPVFVPADAPSDSANCIGESRHPSHLIRRALWRPCAQEFFPRVLPADNARADQHSRQSEAGGTRPGPFRRFVNARTSAGQRRHETTRGRTARGTEK